MTRIRILLTNDDGYSAPGIQALYQQLHQAYDVTIVAPATEQSGIGHAFTFKGPISYRPIEAETGLPGFAVTGTPSDCVKFAVSHLLPQKPDFVISGLNNGENSGTAGYYSGTVAAAREGAFWRIPSLAFSVCDKAMTYLCEYAEMATSLLSRFRALPADVHVNGHGPIYYNINFPACHPSDVKGIRITRQSLAFFDDRYRPEKLEDGSTRFWLYGEKKDLELSDQYDSRALENGYVAITPLHFDATATSSFSSLSTLEANL
jgi:5'-nucleotidase